MQYLMLRTSFAQAVDLIGACIGACIWYNALDHSKKEKKRKKEKEKKV